MEKYNVKFKKKFGQNFLKDDSIVKRIVDSADITPRSLVLEVGPGGAIMTRELARDADNVLAYEIDSSLESEINKRLANVSNVKVIYKDFLQANIMNDISSYDYDNLYFISNVPYYITTPIILKLIDSGLKFKKIVMMVQKEVGDRFSSKCGNKEYGSISVILQYFFDIKLEFFVSRDEFVPIPNVDSVVISFTEKKDRPKIKDYSFFQSLVKDSFRFKRKTIKNNLGKYDLKVVESVLLEHNLSLKSRAEELDLSVFVDLANRLID